MDYASLWDARIMLDLFLGGVGVGVFLLLAFGPRGGKGNERATMRVGAVVSFALVAVGALLLVSELGRPFGVAATLTGFNPTSITSWGGLLQVGFLAADAVLCAMLFGKNEAVLEGMAAKAVIAVGACLAAFVLVYHGLVLNSVGRGLWADAFVVPLFMASSLAAGGAVALVVDQLTGKVFTADAARFTAASSLAVGVLVLMFGFSVAPAGADAVLCYDIMMEQMALVWWMGAFGLGAVVPLAISAFSLIRSSAWTMPMLAAMATSAVLGSFALKYVITSTAQIVLG